MAEAPRTAKQCLLLKSFDMTNGVHMEKFEPKLFGSEIIPVYDTIALGIEPCLTLL